MSETPIGDEVIGTELGYDGEELGEVVDDGTDDVPETDEAEHLLDPAPEAVDDPAEAAEGADEDEDEDPGVPEPDDPPVVMTSPYAIPGEGNQGGNEPLPPSE